MVKRPIALLMLAAVAALVWWRSGDRPGQGTEPGERPMERAGIPTSQRLAAKQRDGEIIPLDRPGIDPRSRPTVGDSVDSDPVEERFPSQLFRPDEYQLGRMQIFGEFWRTAEAEWNARRYRLAEEDEALLDGHDAYQVYVYLRTCLDAPRDARQADRYLKRIENAAEYNRRFRDSRRLERILDRVDAALIRCEGLHEDLEADAMAWLTRAAKKGYPLAQIAYYRSYRWLATRKPYLIFGDVDGVYAYRTLAPRLLDAALGSGHAEAFMEMARALDEGIVFERNGQAAYAYALAAREAGRPELDVAAEIIASLEEELDPFETREARRMARELCDAYCL